MQKTPIRDTKKIEAVGLIAYIYYGKETFLFLSVVLKKL